MTTTEAVATGSEADRGSAGTDDRAAGPDDHRVWTDPDGLAEDDVTDIAHTAAGPPTSRRRGQDEDASRDAAQSEKVPSDQELTGGRPALPGIALIDPAMIARELRSGLQFGEIEDELRSTSREDEDRLAFLRRYATRPGGLMRRQLLTDAETDARLEALRAEAPNGAAVIDIVRRAALLSWHAGTPLRIPPILILGPPGTGKTRLARRLAQVLGTTLTTIDGGATTDRGPFVGHEVGYRGSGPGRVAFALLDGDSAGPLMLLDEVEKVCGYGHGAQPLNALLGLLEPATAQLFVDTYVGLPMHAEGVTWIMTANATDGLSGPLLDRAVVVEMQRLGRAETRAALQRMLAELLAEHGLPVAELGTAALDRLQTAGLRQARRTLALALGPALAADRAAPDAADIASAAALLDRPAGRARGLKGRAKPVAAARAPVGFIRFPYATPVVRPNVPPPRRRGRGAVSPPSDAEGRQTGVGGPSDRPDGRRDRGWPPNSSRPR